jgi:release factor glutamine methyltransferase
MLDGISGEFDLLVSNPPYISNSAKLDDSVLQEPHLALFGGDTGDEFLKELIFKAKEKRVSKYIACEMGYDQKEAMKETLNAAKASFVSFYKDLAGLD